MEVEARKTTSRTRRLTQCLSVWPRPIIRVNGKLRQLGKDRITKGWLTPPGKELCLDKVLAEVRGL